MNWANWAIAGGFAAVGVGFLFRSFQLWRKNIPSYPGACLVAAGFCFLIAVCAIFLE